MVNPELIKPLPFKEIPMPEWFSESEEKEGHWTARLRVVFFDPAPIYERISELINPNKRIQSGLNIELMFPSRNDGICRCGCGHPAKRSWATSSCSNFCWKVYFIICYGTQYARKFIETYYGSNCMSCSGNGCDIDHIIPVKHGGGGCWLSNFVPLCKKCHNDKTRKDFKWGEYRPIIQTQLDIL